MNSQEGGMAMAVGGILGQLVQGMSPDSDDAMSEKSDPRVGGKVTQWATDNDVDYYAVGRTETGLPPGAYQAINVRGAVIFKKFDIDITGLMRLPDSQSDKIIAEIEKFWTRGERFKQYKITQRRGILVVGPTGCGKTCTSKMAYVDVIKRGGIVLPYTDPDALIPALGLFRRIQPDTPIVIMIEDVDAVAGSHRADSSGFLNMLDGVYAEFNRVVFVATTNYPERLEARITNRPSRFDTIITMENPNEASRLLYLNTLAPDIDPAIFNIAQATKDSEKLNFAHLKELFTSVVILDMPYAEALKKVRKMVEEELPSGDEMEYGGPNGQMGFVGEKMGAMTKARSRRFR